RTRRDFEATRIGVPWARRARSAALASKASRSSTATGRCEMPARSRALSSRPACTRVSISGAAASQYFVEVQIRGGREVLVDAFDLERDGGQAHALPVRGVPGGEVIDLTAQGVGRAGHRARGPLAGGGDVAGGALGGLLERGALDRG